MLIPDTTERDAVAVARRLCVAVAQPYEVAGLAVHTSCSIGISLSPQDGHDHDALLQRADVAMYAAKADRSGFQVYATAADQYSPRRLALLGDLREAVETGSLHVQYQPIVDLRTSAVAGVEALVRWHHPYYGVIPPDEFLPLAEHTDLMLPLTAFVLRTALEDTAAWQSQGVRLDVSVNISPRVLLDPVLPRLIGDRLAETGLPGQRLTVEITEHSVFSAPARSAAVLGKLHGMGVALSVDDFGTGYGSLSYLRELPVDEVKIDRSFVFDVARGGSDAAIVRSTIELGHRLGMRVVAEGVETEEMWDELSAMSCDVAQGYLMSKPLPAAAVLAWHAGWTATSHTRSAPGHRVAADHAATPTPAGGAALRVVGAEAARTTYRRPDAIELP